MKIWFFTTLSKTPIWPILILSLRFLVLKSLDLCVCLALNYHRFFSFQNIHIFLEKIEFLHIQEDNLWPASKQRVLLLNKKSVNNFISSLVTLVSQGCIRLDFHGGSTSSELLSEEGQHWHHFYHRNINWSIVYEYILNIAHLCGNDNLGWLGVGGSLSSLLFQPQ